MSDSIHEKADWKKAELPPAGEIALVQGEGFRCMAYRDKEGKWRDYIRRMELPGKITVISTIQPP
jgi:hypothetical protein